MIEVFCDGGSRGNPGPAAWGFVVKIDKNTVYKDHGYIGIASNNLAEYTAVVKALTWLGEKYRGEDLDVNLDSQLASFQLSGLYKVKNPKLRELIFQIRTLESNFRQVSYKHINRNLNTEADAQVNQALDEIGT
ncbi:hypothetical protein A2165_01235 [Candidatus Curtissbacteria bacterium RBG_13_40_7]|uniref:RNase H type-1 domain-containing protein n=1 Tax=Candidatus Curtissbacteria bacterium RBG_13_40_7 TaxID=1797706 RepID=A0A1F5FXH0_9BACT|nr:MAG: hypothetical protein A2165_01235 [Candidatus Curtissbacteria bacterium RBG_13_40_7]